jgi:hypothetical protein
MTGVVKKIDDMNLDLDGNREIVDYDSLSSIATSQTQN